MESLNTRKPVFAGSFYPASQADILAFIEKKLTSMEDSEMEQPLHISGLIVPHAGWIYSGKTALAAYRLLEKIKPAKIALLGPSHRVVLNTAVRDEHDFWESPLGLTSVIPDEDFEISCQAHATEHSLEVQLPFIRYFVPDCKILPLVVGQLNENQPDTLAKKLIDKNYFLIISTDLSHFYSLEEARKRDVQSITNIEAVQPYGVDACGINPLKIAFAVMHHRGLKPHLIDYSTSAEVSGDTSSVVGYASFWM